jgi:hypothetical protein
MTNRSMSHLSTLCDLRHCSLKCSHVSGKGLKHLRALVRLESLKLDDCSLLTDDSLIHLKMLTAVQQLCMRGCEHVTNRGVAFVTSSMGQIEVSHLHPAAIQCAPQSRCENE